MKRTCGSCNVVRWLRGFSCSVFIGQRTVLRPVGRINLRAVPFSYLLGKYLWFRGVGITHFKDTGTKLVESVQNAQKCNVFRTTLKAHFQRGSCTWFKIEPQSLYPTWSGCNVFRAETRTAKPLYSSLFHSTLSKGFSVSPVFL